MRILSTCFADLDGDVRTVVVHVGDQRHILVAPLQERLDLAEAARLLHVRRGDTHDLGALAVHRDDLRDHALDVVRLLGDHRLDDDGVPAAYDDVADAHGARLAARVGDGRHSGRCSLSRPVGSPSRHSTRRGAQWVPLAPLERTAVDRLSHIRHNECHGVTRGSGKGTPVKPLRFLRPADDDMHELPEAVRRAFSHARHTVQFGEMPDSASPFEGSIGGNIMKLAARHGSDTYRCVFAAKLEDAVYVLHVFKKKSMSGIATPRREIDTVIARFRRAQELHSEEFGPPIPLAGGRELP